MEEILDILSAHATLLGFKFQIWMLMAIAFAAVVLLVVLPDIIGK
jgi:hypothetical protein